MKRLIFLGLILLFPLTVQGFSFERNLFFGISNDQEVVKLQEFLTVEGVYTGPITGNFFSLTLQGVKNFQAREGIYPIAGYFGPLTRARSNTLLGTQIQESDQQAIDETGAAPVVPIQKTQIEILQEQIAEIFAQITLVQQQLLQLQSQMAQSTGTISEQEPSSLPVSSPTTTPSSPVDPEVTAPSDPTPEDTSTDLVAEPTVDPVVEPVIEEVSSISVKTDVAIEDSFALWGGPLENFTSDAFEFTAVNDYYTVTEVTITISDVSNIDHVTLKAGAALSTKSASPTIIFSGLSIHIKADKKQMFSVELSMFSPVDSSPTTTFVSATAYDSKGISITITE